MRKKIAVCAAQRSGTHALTSVIGLNGFASFDEVFLPDPVGWEESLSAQGHFRTWIAKRGVSVNDFILWPETYFVDYFAFLDTLTPYNYTVDIKYNGARVMQNAYQEPSDPPPLFRVMRDAGFTFVHLKRMNAFLRYVSDRLGNATGQYHFYRDAEIDVKDAKLTIDINDCLRSVGSHLKNIEVATGWLSDLQHVNLEYETAFEDGRLTEAAREALSRLGITITNPHPDTIKPRRNLLDTIANFDDVAAALIAHGYDDMIRNI